jgi:hypothetical protein
MAAGGVVSNAMLPFSVQPKEQNQSTNDLFWIKNIPNRPFYSKDEINLHAGIDCLIYLMGKKGLKLYRSDKKTRLSGPSGMIGPEDVVLIKVNAQWKYRGCTNSDLVRGLIQRILDHPDTFTGEVVIFENGQGRGSLNCDTGVSPAYPDDLVHANANDESHSYLYLVDTVFNDPRVSSYLLDPISNIFIEENDHVTDGYRIFENVSYPCFTTAGGHRVELKEGIWENNSHNQNLKLINIPVLKHHDKEGSEITASLKNFYGIVSMADPFWRFRHYDGLGETCGKMATVIRTPILNILDSIWVCHMSCRGYPPETTFRANQIMASQDPVALDYYGAKNILYPIDGNHRHHPEFAGIHKWLVNARTTMNSFEDLYNPDKGILIDRVTFNEEKVQVHSSNARKFIAQQIERKEKRTSPRKRV